MSVIDQKEYLKKYLSGDTDSNKLKKRKKKVNIIKDRVKIIDDDLDISTCNNVTADKLDEFLTAEDAPQVVGVIDDRPPALRLDDYRKSSKWKLVGSDDEECTKKLFEMKNDLSPVRKKTRSDSDTSPVRRSDDISPPRRRKHIDISPPRRRRKSDSPQSKRPTDSSPARKKPRNNRKEVHKSPTRRKSRWEQDSGDSKSKNEKHNEHHSKKRSYVSPSRTPEKTLKIPDGKKRSVISHSKTPEKMTKTLDGKTAGLQNAQDLKTETTAFKKREDELFKNMSKEVSGENAAPIMRDRKTGKKRDFEKEEEDELEKKKKEDEQKQKYAAWGKGLKQVEDYNEKLKSDLHEMSKPLARYADDEDLEKFLREQEREGDPMLEYMRKKKKKKAIASGIPLKPMYDGEFMPNRYAIPPGHRWDGVDRSNGYEKQWFAKQNAKKAVDEEVYKWSTEDM